MVQRQLRELVSITLAFVSRETFNVAKRKTLQARNPFQLIIKIWAWTQAMAEEGFKPEKYMLVAIANSGKIPPLVERILSEAKIPLLKSPEDLKKFSG